MEFLLFVQHVAHVYTLGGLHTRPDYTSLLIKVSKKFGCVGNEGFLHTLWNLRPARGSWAAYEGTETRLLGFRQRGCRLLSTTEGLMHRLHPLLQQIRLYAHGRDLLLHFLCLYLQREDCMIILCWSQSQDICCRHSQECCLPLMHSNSNAIFDSGTPTFPERAVQHAML